MLSDCGWAINYHHIEPFSVKPKQYLRQRASQLAKLLKKRRLKAGSGCSIYPRVLRGRGGESIAKPQEESQEEGNQQPHKAAA